MKSHVTGTPVLGELRHALTALIIGNPLLSPQEQLLANQQVHECEDAGRLALWLANMMTASGKCQRTSSSLTD
ncbi:hypothetical protein CDA63_18915 [Hymenobacter amundsenii]|uniref:Uncharacterized protein n=1 Tax=Hymenobacter amundsenii TaxID=2006685 RepID=A0A246FG87_9BACT|nr:hypothetical protein [Hymenobacter amundsenii]OWP61536.1 hypothetical protein CDA63_18915 [Hymenobacter amundsenii]